jgi:GxxExxY protein
VYFVDKKPLRKTTMELIFKEEAYAIQGAVFEVYREMGCGFLEPVYQECLEKELRQRGIPFTAQQKLTLTYKGDPLLQTYEPDLICYGKIIIELKAVKVIAPEHRAQILNYLKATGHRLGLLANFGHSPKVEIERFVL